MFRAQGLGFKVTELCRRSLSRVINRDIEGSMRFGGI